MILTTPNDFEIRSQLKRILDAALGTTFGSIVIPRWDKALVAEGQNLNIGLVDGVVRVWFLSLLQDKTERIGDVPEIPQLTEGLDFTRRCEWIYRIKFLLSYDDSLDENARTSEDRFSSEIQVVTDALAREPKLGLGDDFIRHDDLQIVKRSLPGYGSSGLCHTADALLTVHFYQFMQFP